MKFAAQYLIFLGAVSLLSSCSLIFAEGTDVTAPPSDAVLACRSYVDTAASTAEQCNVSLRPLQCDEREVESCEGRAEYYRCLENNIECVDGEIRHNDASCNLDCGISNARRCDILLSDPTIPENVLTLCFALREQACDAGGVFDCLEYFGRSDADTFRLCASQSDCSGVETFARCLEFSERPDVRACGDVGRDLCSEIGRCNDPEVFDCLDDTFTCRDGEPNISPACVQTIEACLNSQGDTNVPIENCELFMRGAEQCSRSRVTPASCNNLRFIRDSCEGMSDFFGCLNATSLCTDEDWLSFPAYCSEQSECSNATRGLASCISAQQRVQALPCAEDAWLTLDQCLGELRDTGAPARNACLQERPRCEGSQLSFECYDAGFEGEGEGEDFGEGEGEEE